MRNDKILAYKMRMRGQSYTEIAKGLGMSKSTLSLWFRHLELPEEAKQKIKTRSHTASINALLKINKELTQKAEQRAKTARSLAKQKISNLSKRELLLIGATLYWANGYKKPITHNKKLRTYHPVCFTHTDPTMIALFVKFLKETCGVQEERILADLRVFHKQTESQALAYWSKITDLPFSSFRKTYKDNHPTPYGTIQIRVNDTALFHTVMGWIEGLQNL